MPVLLLVSNVGFSSPGGWWPSMAPCHLGGDLQASLDVQFCSNVLCSPSWEKPKLTPGRAGEPKPGAPHPSKGEKNYQAKVPPRGEFPKQILGLGSPCSNGKAPGGFPSAHLEEDPQQHGSQAEGHGSQGAPVLVPSPEAAAGGEATAENIWMQRRRCRQRGCRGGSCAGSGMGAG